LGDTLAEIAFEKGGIIKPGIPVVSAPQPVEALQKLEEIAAERGSPFILAGRDWRFVAEGHRLTITGAPPGRFLTAPQEFEVALIGRHQLENAAVAVAALAEAQTSFPQLDETAVRVGLATVQWPGRLQLIHEAPGEPSLLVDSAHNADSAKRLAAALGEHFSYERLLIIFGAPTDKAIPEMMATLFPLAEKVIVSMADHPRATSPAELAALAAELGFQVNIAPTAADALRQAMALAGPGDLICATGSIIFIGDLLNQWERLQSAVQAQQGSTHAVG
jgi:dihydrofolate synthase/folylpolyglutamate synthase